MAMEARYQQQEEERVRKLTKIYVAVDQVGSNRAVFSQLMNFGQDPTLSQIASCIFAPRMTAYYLERIMCYGTIEASSVNYINIFNSQWQES